VHNLAMAGIVLASGILAVVASTLVVGIIWVVVDHCEDFSTNTWEE
jgi:hypothetical protein